MNSLVSHHEGWSAMRKIAFRFILIFFSLYILPFPINQIPELGGEVGSWYFQFMNWLVGWGAEAFFGLEEFPPGSPGSGDRTFSWVQLFMVVLIATVGCIIWSILDRKRQSYARLWRWFHILATFNLAYWLFVYGLIKVVGEQFGYIGISRMLETFGESSPMRMMWTFMSASQAYEQFSGWSETIAGALLLFRRTRTIGALAAAGVMLNVFMMNMTYDVPVKLFSFRLMLMGIYIALADRERLFSIFLLNRSVGKLDWPPFFKTKWKNYTLLGIQILLAGYIVINLIISQSQSNERFSRFREKPALYGIHDVDEFVVNGDTIPPLLTDTVRWKKTFMDLPGFSSLLFGVKMMDDRLVYYSATVDTTALQLTLSPFRDTVNRYVFDYEWVEGNLQMSGIMNGDTLDIKTTYFDPDDFLIRSRGFHWISEVPYNRRVPYRNR